MHRLLSTEWPARDASGYYGAEAHRDGCSSESHQAANQRGFPVAPDGTARRLGPCAESAFGSRHGRISSAGAGTIAPFSGRPAAAIIRGAGYALRLFLLGLIRFYQICLSPIIPSSCRYYPTCSAYAFEAVDKWGAWEGTRLAIRRLLHCHPWGGHGYDPVPLQSVENDQEC